MLVRKPQLQKVISDARAPCNREEGIEIYVIVHEITIHPEKI